MYVFQGQNLNYIGKTHLWRWGNGGAPGAVRRFAHEHLVWRAHAKGAEGGKYRYRAARSSPACSLSLFVARVDSHYVIHNMELLFINSEGGKDNDKRQKKKPKHGAGNKRRRQRPHLRKQQKEQNPDYDPDTDLDGPLDSEIARQYTYVNRPRGIKQKQETQLEKQKWKDPYKQAYWKTMQWNKARYDDTGPINIYERRYKRLLLLYASKTDAPIQWDLLDAHRPGKYDALLLSDQVENIEERGRKRALRRKINAHLHKMGITTASNLSMKVSHKSHISPLRRVVTRTLHVCTSRPPQVVRWILRRTRFHVASEGSAKSWQDGPAKLRELTEDELFSIPDEEASKAVSGASLRRIPGTTRVPIARNPDEWAQHYKDRVSKWAKQARIAQRDRAKLSLNLSKTVLPEPHYDDSQKLAEFEQFKDSYARCEKGDVKVPEDKSPHESWNVPLPGYAHLTLKSARLSGWEHKQGVSVTEANEHVRSHMLEFLPDRFRHLRKKIQTYGPVQVPYTYTTIKKKCHKSGTMVCPKDKHQHWRKIVSYAAFWGKPIARKVRRGIELAVRRLPTFEVFTTRGAAQKLRAEVAQLQGEDRWKHTCACCKQDKKPLEFSVCDASQFYEQAGLEESAAAVQWCLQEVTNQTGKTTVTAVQDKGVQGRIGGKLAGFVPACAKTVCFSFTELLSFFCMFGCIPLVLIGQTVWLLSHTPIGSLHGKMAAVCLAGKSEIEFDNAWHLISYLFDVGGYLRKNAIALLRYTDDTIAASRILCHSCQTRIIQLIYSVEFSPASVGTDVEWLHMRAIANDEGEMIILPTFKNSDLASGKSAEPGKNNTPPWWAPHSTVTISGIIRGAVLRWEDVNRSPRVLRRLGWELTIEFLSKGYEIRALKRAWARQPHSRVRNDVLTLLNQVKKNGLSSERIDKVQRVAAQEEENRDSEAQARNTAEAQDTKEISDGDRESSFYPDSNRSVPSTQNMGPRNQDWNNGDNSRPPYKGNQNGGNYSYGRKWHSNGGGGGGNEFQKRAEWAQRNMSGERGRSRSPTNFGRDITNRSHSYDNRNRSSSCDQSPAFQIVGTGVNGQPVYQHVQQQPVVQQQQIQQPGGVVMQSPGIILQAPQQQQPVPQNPAMTMPGVQAAPTFAMQKQPDGSTIFVQNPPPVVQTAPPPAAPATPAPTDSAFAAELKKQNGNLSKLLTAMTAQQAQAQQQQGQQTQQPPQVQGAGTQLTAAELQVATMFLKDVIPEVLADSLWSSMDSDLRKSTTTKATLAAKLQAMGGEIPGTGIIGTTTKEQIVDAITAKVKAMAAGVVA